MANLLRDLDGSRLHHRCADLLRLDRHHPVRHRVAAYRGLRPVAVRPNHCGATGRRRAVVSRQRDLGDLRGMVAGSGTPAHQHPAVRVNHRHPIWVGELETHPYLPYAVGTRGRSDRSEVRGKVRDDKDTARSAPKN